MSDCPHCTQNPCLWHMHEETIMGEVSIWIATQEETEEVEALTNNLIRKKCYQLFVSFHHGFLGKGKREKLPGCVTTAIREAFPDSSDTYMGFKHS